MTHTLRTALAAIALALAACGAGGPEDDDADGGVELEQPDAAPGPIPDAAVPAAAQCTPDAGSGDATAAACWTLPELAAHGCRAVLVGTATAGKGSSTTVLADADAAAKAAHFALTYLDPSAVTLYLCASPAPATGWQCVSHTLSDCAADTASGTCTQRVVVPALPTMSAVCARRPA